jgi:uridine kinase
VSAFLTEYSERPVSRRSRRSFATSRPSISPTRRSPSNGLDVEPKVVARVLHALGGASSRGGERVSRSGSIVRMSREETITRYNDLAARILERPSERSRLVAVDGPGGTGKSFFAQRLAGALGNAPIVHTDDFATGESGVEWWPRLDREVLQPLVNGHTGRYQRYDWDRRALMEWHDVPAAPVVIIDGVSSARREIAPHLALAVWVQAPRAVRLARGLERDGEEARGDWERWMAEEDSHFRSDDTIARCQVFVNGAPTRPHVFWREFVQFDSCDYE